MNIVRGTWRNGQVALDAPVDWPEGRRLIVSEERPSDIEFMTEEEQSDDPQEVERRIAELEALPGLDWTPEQEAELLEWRRRAKEFNLAAVRRQMEEGTP